MNNEVLVTQLRDLGNAAQSLATAITMLYANLSINIPSVDEQQEQNTNHCGQDAAPAASQNITVESLYKLLRYQVICFLAPGENSRCEQCPFNPNDPEDCVKVELVGGSYLCLAPQDKPSADDIDNVVINPQEQ